MATWFSDHYTETGVDQSSLPVLPATGVPDSSRYGGKLMCIRSYISVTTATTTDEFRFCTMQSGDRVHFANTYLDGGWDASTILNLGLFTPGDGHDGAVIRNVIFAAALSVASAVDTWDSSEHLTEPSAFGGEHRGLTNWERVNISNPGTYPSNPNLAMDVAGVLSGANITTIGEMILEIWYTPQGA